MTAAKEKLVGLIAYLRKASMEIRSAQRAILAPSVRPHQSALVFAIIPGGGVA